MKYMAATGGEEFVVDVGEHGEVRVNDMPHAVHLDSIDGVSHFALLIGPRSYDVFVERAEDAYAITVDGVRHFVQIGEEQLARVDLPARKQARSTDAPVSARIGNHGTEARVPAPGAVHSPMTGVLVEILTSVGRTVEAGEGVAILEAMKTENVVRAPIGGTVKSIQASTGQSLRMDEVIMCLEPLEDRE